MPCCLGILALSVPRFVILLLVFLSDYIGEAYETNLLPFLGFLFLPTTTLAYAWSIHSRGEVSGLGLILVIVGALIDLGAIGSGASSRRSSG